MKPRVLAWPAFRKERANPHAALLARALIAQGVALGEWRPLAALLRCGDLWHLHHPETVLYRRNPLVACAEALAFLSLLAIARRRGVRVVWTIHDLGSNDRLHPRLEALFWRCFVPEVDAAICLSESGRRDALARFPDLANRPVQVIPHGHYADAYPSGIGRQEARRRLDLPEDARVILHFGLIRPYKNVPRLIDCFRSIEDPKAYLVVAGQPFDAEVEAEVRRAALGADRLALHLRWIAPEEVQVYFSAADLVALPYREVTNSGAVFLALSFARPVLVPDRGAMPDNQQRFGGAWVRLYRGELTPGILADALARSKEPRPPLHLDDLGWDEIARRTRHLYDEIVGSIGDHPARRPGEVRQ